MKITLAGHGGGNHKRKIIKGIKENTLKNNFRTKVILYCSQESFYRRETRENLKLNSNLLSELVYASE